MIAGTLPLSSDFTVVPILGSERTDLKIVVCNSISLDNYFYINVSNSKTGLNTILYFNFPILAFDTYVAPFTYTLSTGDTISAKATNSGLTLSLIK
jgi:hypothetical protein